MSEQSNETELKFIDSMALNGPIEDMLQQAVKQTDLEFEWIYGDTYSKIYLDKDKFLKLKRCLNESTEYNAMEEINDLDIRCELKHRGKSVTSNMRATVSGLSQIKQYCIQDNFDDLEPTFIKKLKYRGSKDDSTDYSVASSGLYPMRATLKQEQQLFHVGSRIKKAIQQVPVSSRVESEKQVQLFLTNWSSKNKHFRFKKRYSYVTSNHLWRIDLTAVKSSGTNQYAKSFKESGILQKKETFELEIEYIGSHRSTYQRPIETYVDNHYQCLLYQREEESTFRPSEYSNENPFAFGSLYNPEIPTTGNDSTNELAFSSSSYTDGIEFDEPAEAINSPRDELPNSVLIRDEYWIESEQESIRDLLLQLPHLPKLIPRRNDTTSGQYLVEICPHLEVPNENGESESYKLETIYVPYQYIIGSVSSSLPADENEGYTPASPRVGSVSGGSVSGGSVPDPYDRLSKEYYSKDIIEDLLTNLNTHIHYCYSCIEDTELYLDTLEQGDVLKEYIQLTDPTNVIHKTGWTFVGPQPVSMGTIHLNPLNPNSITHGYTVTEKADGLRAQLLITESQRGYLLTPKKQIIDTGVTFSEARGQWLFDGEYITQNKDKESIKLFMIFDVYYSSEFSTQPYSYPWIKHKKSKGTSRSEIIHEFRKRHKDAGMIRETEFDSSCVRIGFKEYLEGPEVLKQKKDGSYSNITSMFKSNQKILNDNAGGFEYETDGLIFLPMFLPVKGMMEGDIVKSIRGTWPLNYKWKPAEENTIDFKIIFCKKNGKPEVHSYDYVSPEGMTETRYYQKVQVAVQYKEQDDPMIDFNWSVLTDKPYNKQSYQYFDPPTHKKDNIHITNIPLTKHRMLCLKDGREITNGSIVEMRYNPKSPHKFTWVPLRLRDDKITPQYFTVANNVWSTINDPVTTEMIQGAVEYENLPTLSSTNKYYVDTKFAEDTPIRALHNYIKSKLISRIGSSPDMKGSLSIVDLSCGRGGDIKKYMSIRNKINFILGLDVSDNINEAAQRYHYLRKPKPPALFLQYDTSRSIRTRDGCTTSEDKTKQEICKTMLDMIEGKSTTYPKQYKQIRRTYENIASKGYDLVSSQFSLHYYFKDEETLRGFCQNVSHLCADKGYFIGTCFDGMKVFKTMESLNTDILDMKDSFGSLVYQIKKKYSIRDFSYDKSMPQDMFGQEIDVFMASIGQTITEYLVNFEYFIDIMKEYGFELALPTFKKGEYNPIREPIQSFDQIIHNLSEIKEKDFNFVKKTYTRELFDITKDKQYQQLSGLNNWFIFQKK